MILGLRLIQPSLPELYTTIRTRDMTFRKWHLFWTKKLLFYNHFFNTSDWLDRATDTFWVLIDAPRPPPSKDTKIDTIRPYMEPPDPHILHNQGHNDTTIQLQVLISHQPFWNSNKTKHEVLPHYPRVRSVYYTLQLNNVFLVNWIQICKLGQKVTYFTKILLRAFDKKC